MIKLDYLQEQFRSLNESNRVRKGAPPRTTISDALTEQFFNIVEFLQSELVLEVGAHEASFSQEMRRRLPNATIFAFEANPHVHEKYKDHIYRSCADINYEWRAISDSDEELELFIPTSIRGVKRPLANRMGSLNLLRNSKVEGTVVRVPGGTLDGILSHHIGKSVALWIDVEGAVDRVLQGATLMMSTAQAVMCEVETASIWTKQATDNEILRIFEQFGLIPVLRDCVAQSQYNVILLRKEYVDDPLIATMVKTFEAQVAEILVAHSTSSIIPN
jgi:FkbM family methyltransferase